MSCQVKQSGVYRRHQWVSHEWASYEWANVLTFVDGRTSSQVLHLLEMSDGHVFSADTRVDTTSIPYTHCR